MKGQDAEFAFLIGIMIGLIVMAIVLTIVIIPEKGILKDGICKLKFGEEYRHTDTEWEKGNLEVICEKYQKPDIDSIVIRKGAE